MISPASLMSGSHGPRVWLIASFIIVAFGVKLCVIAAYGNATPFWDEWDAMAANLFKPYFNGTLTWHEWLAPHNEHRLLTTRALALFLVAVNGLWDPLLQMIVDGGLHIALGVLILLTLGRRLDDAAFVFLTILVTLLIATPNAAENVLLGMQAHFYCLLLFGYAAILLMTWGSGRWPLRAAGFLLAVLSFLSLASGTLVFLACAFILAFRFATGVERGWKIIVFILLLLAGFAIGVMVTPSIDGHKVLRAHSIWEFCRAFIVLAGWPFRSPAAFGAVIVNVPLALLAWSSLRRSPPADHIAWPLLAIGLWTMLQFAAIAFGRAHAISATRYFDICAMNLIVNFVCIAQTNFIRSRKKIVAGAIALVALAWVVQTVRYVPAELRERRETALNEERNVQAFLRTGRFPDGATGKDLTLPYPDARRLAALLSDNTIRRILPSPFQSVSGEEPQAAAAGKDRLGPIRDGLLWFSPAMAALGILSLSVGAFLMLRRRRDLAAPN